MSVLRPGFIYGAKTMCITTKDEEKFKIVENEIIRQISGSKKFGEDEYRCLSNHEIGENLKIEDLVKMIKSIRIRRYGHIDRSEKSSVVGRITEWWKTCGGRKRGRPKS